jgi:hypothetical protein
MWLLLIRFGAFIITESSGASQGDRPISQFFGGGAGVACPKTLIPEKKSSFF